MAKVKKEEIKEVKVPYLLVNYLAEKINLLNVPTYGDIEKFKKLQDKLSSINQELQEKTRELFEKYGITEVKEGDEHFDSINKDYKILLNSDSTISKQEIELFTKEDFERVFNGTNLKVADALTLEYWIVK